MESIRINKGERYQNKK